MTTNELKTLVYFRDGERDIYGNPIPWEEADYQTFYWLAKLRQRLDSSIQIIRHIHPNKPTAVDWCCPGRMYHDVVMETLRLPDMSYGFYSGNSVHIDRRVYDFLPARWLAVKPQERVHLTDASILSQVTGEANGWVYLAWSWEALQLVIELADRKAAS